MQSASVALRSLNRGQSRSYYPLGPERHPDFQNSEQHLHQLLVKQPHRGHSDRMIGRRLLESHSNIPLMCRLSSLIRISCAKDGGKEPFLGCGLSARGAREMARCPGDYATTIVGKENGR